MRRTSVALALLGASAYAPLGARPRPLRPATVAHLFDANGLPIEVAPAESGSDEDHEILLGELIFSSRDPREDVARNPKAYTEGFLKFVGDKAEDSDDLEERAALNSLVDMVRQTLVMVEKAEKDAEEARRRAEDMKQGILSEEDAALLAQNEAAQVSQTDVLRAANAATLDGIFGPGYEAPEETGPSEAGLRGDALATYAALLDELVAADGADLGAAVENAYDRCDYALLGLATERRDGGHPDAAALGRVVEAINALSAQRLTEAAGRLGSVLQAGSPVAMFDKISEMAVLGQVDAPLVELLEANRQQAEAAGPAGAQAAELMKNLANRCRDEMDKRLAKDAPEKRLLRTLLRSADAETQEAVLRRAFEPKDAITLGFGDEAKTTQEGPEVEPPKFIEACKQLVAEFGNVDDNGQPLAMRVRAIADVAEKVATELYGDIMSPREQQDRMMTEGTTSIFDLEAAEMAAEMKGETMPWHSDDTASIVPPGFEKGLKEGELIKKIGG
mmetsp:Transcript_14647/g.43759  ORF Transcript_14647/g.43759 Transcript_14647/m.43759 type:complete len:505 (-) Transcript_14647:77-1591(-)